MKVSTKCILMFSCIAMLFHLFFKINFVITFFIEIILLGIFLINKSFIIALQIHDEKPENAIKFYQMIKMYNRK